MAAALAPPPAAGVLGGGRAAAPPTAAPGLATAGGEELPMPRSLSERADELIARIAPSPASGARRHAIAGYVRASIRRCFHPEKARAPRRGLRVGARALLRAPPLAF
jgi:hypothetical protein